jgi:hypothetical protein
MQTRKHRLEIAKKYRQSVKGKAIQKVAFEKYRKSTLGLTAIARYENSRKGVKTRKQYYKDNKEDLLAKVRAKRKALLDELAYLRLNQK